MSPTAIFMKKVQHINITAKKGSFKKRNVHIGIIIFQVNIRYSLSERTQHSTPNLPNTDCIVRKKYKHMTC